MKKVKLFAASAIVIIALCFSILPALPSDAMDAAKAGPGDNTNTRQSPVECQYPGLTTKAGEALVFSLAAADPDNDVLTYSASNLPPGATFDPQTGTFAWTPGYDQAGTYPNIHFEVSDGQLTDSEDITITVINFNRPPVLNSIGDKSAAEQNPLEFTISATDPDNDALTFSASNLPTGAIFNAQTGIFSWTPAAGQQGTYPGVRFTATDGQLTDTEEITITVTSGSDTRVSVESAFTLSDLQISPLIAEAGKRAYVHVTVTNSGTVNGAYDVVLRMNGLVEETRTVKLSAGSSLAVTFTVIKKEADEYLVDVNGLTGSYIVVDDKRAPVLEGIGDKSVTELSRLEFTLEATDLNSKSLTFSASNLPPGAVFNTKTGTFSWTPAVGQRGTYPHVCFTVSDGKLTDSESITITVTGANSAPVIATIGDKSIAEQQLLEFAVKATDPDNDALTFSASNLPTGAIFNAQTGVFSWTPAAGQAGTYPNVRFTATDGQLIDTEEITITVTSGSTASATSSTPVFAVSDLYISPLKADVGKRAYVHVNVTNSGTVNGAYDVVLRMNGLVEETRTVKLSAGSSLAVTFTVIQYEAGVYMVDVNGLTGSYTVVSTDSALR